VAWKGDDVVAAGRGGDGMVLAVVVVTCTALRSSFFDVWECSSRNSATSWSWGEAEDVHGIGRDARGWGGGCSG
jgi:hypothetical protein